MSSSFGASPHSQTVAESLCKLGFVEIPGGQPGSGVKFEITREAIHTLKEAMREGRNLVFGDDYKLEIK